ncbi:BolA family protein [Chachezhania sediminis]|uniref:BolA family protein n=1 Tax=Chachezhania sediminis TaxID=2599291 RepID=UPI00131D32D0|nr:BolA family protein [Chachezhania sediminis]
MNGTEPVADAMRTRLEAAFDPRELNIVDESEKHRGHAGYQEGGESHFRVLIRSAAFDGQTRIARHRAVHDALGKDLVGRIHALALDIGA